MSAAQLRDSWIAFLSCYEWQWFTSQTFKLPVHPEAADKIFRVWISKLNRSLYGPRWHQKGKSVLWVRALEWQKRNVLHFHALIAAADQDLNETTSRLRWMDEWYNLAGIARITKPITDDAVIRYCTKYLIKDGDLEVSPFLPPIGESFPKFQNQLPGTANAPAGNSRAVRSRGQRLQGAA
jgi:hypothetical protein